MAWLTTALRPREGRTSAAIRLPGQPLDWGRVLELADLHGVMSLLSARLEDDGGAAPEAVRRQLRDRFEQNARRSLALTGELLRLLSLSGRQELRVIPFK